MFARMTEAFAPLDDRGWTFMVLTIDPSGLRIRMATERERQKKRDEKREEKRKAKALAEGKDYKPLPPRGRTLADEAFGALSSMTRGLMDKLKRRYGGLENQWAATVESHLGRERMPHMNIMIWCPALADRVGKEVEKRKAMGMLGRNAVLMDGDLLALATSSGWGVQCTAERARDAEQVASYMVKIAAKADAMVGELAKLSQLPMNAPARFRRLRSGKEFLPPRRKNPNYSGTLVRRTTGPNGEPIVLPLHKVPECDLERVVKVCQIEEDIWIRELQTGELGTLVRDVMLRETGPPVERPQEPC